MTCLPSQPNHRTPGAIRPATAGVEDHRQATLVSLHFRAARGCGAASPAAAPAGHRLALAGAAVIARSVARPGALWDLWLLPAEAKGACAPRGPGFRSCVRRARLAAEARLASDCVPGARAILVLEERPEPQQAGARETEPPRRWVAELAIDPRDGSASMATVDPRAVLSVRRMPLRAGEGVAPAAPDVTIDLEALGLIAPRAAAW